MIRRAAADKTVVAGDITQGAAYLKPEVIHCPKF
jgi:hypothetical protein